MDSRERNIIIVLGVVIIIALVGIGVLAAKLLSSDGGDTTAITVVPTVAEGAAPPEATITAIPAPEMEALGQPPPDPAGSKPVAIARQESLGPIAPVMIVAQPLQPGRRYRLEVTASDGSKSAVQGSWSQAATSASGQIGTPLGEFFEGVTPYQVDINPPVSDPVLWSVSVSAGLKNPNILSDSPKVVITIWDVTGSQ
jgi:hypothetical protein